MSVLHRLAVTIAFLPLIADANDVYVPPQLSDWRAWVLQDKDYRECPFFFNRPAQAENDFICAWPGALDIAVTENGGRFTQQWTVYAAEQWLSLPGDAAYWPGDVAVNGRAASVVLRDGMPSVRVPPGRYTITGRYQWDERPGVLRLPDASGLVSLTVDGRRVARPSRTRAGLFLGDRRQDGEARDSMRTSIYRLVRDDVPTRLATQLRIDVSGGVREALFGPVLPEGFVPLTVTSQLPARLESDGNLRIQVRPGSWVVSLEARAADVRDSVTLLRGDTDMPDAEIWSYLANDRLRVTAAQGLPPVDPRQVQVPGEWRNLPAFRIEPGQALTIEERSRGKVAADNELTLRRQMWLDFAGGGFAVKDTIGGSMRSDWRLDMMSPYQLQSAREHGQNLLVTKGEQDGLTGVELRNSVVDLETIGRAATRKSLPVTGWQSRFVDVSAELHLPPGHKLLAAPGADRAPGSWVSRWQLLDFFLVLITTIAAWRLFGPVAGIIGLLALALTYHEPNSPSWLWLNLLVAMALIRVAPKGRLLRFARVYQGVSALVLALVLVPFLASQLRIAIYPQLEMQQQIVRAVQPGRPVATLPPAAEPDIVPKSDAGTTDRRLQQVTMEDAADELVAAAREASRSYARYAPNAIVQAGPGMPSWEWNTYRLGWSGPVSADQSMRLVVMPRWLVSALRIIAVGLLLLFTAVFAAEILNRRLRLPGGYSLGRPRAASLILIGLGALLSTDRNGARAEIPTGQLLDELALRLSQPPACAPRCAEVAAADVTIDAEAVTMTLTVHGLADVAVPLPGSDEGWRPSAIRVNDAATSEVLRTPDGALWVRLPAGRHDVLLRGAVPDADSLEIPFPTPPRVIEVDSSGWLVAGIKDRRLLAGSLQLTRQDTDAGGDASPRWETSRFPPFVRVERSIELDLDWQVVTNVIRVAPDQGALTLHIPLLPGEAVVSDGFTVADGRILVSMSPDQRALSWRSNLPRSEILDVSAVVGAPWQEIWRIGVGSIWHAEFRGVPESESAAEGSDSRIAEFFPRAGETLTILTTRPEPSAGSTLAFDAASLAVALGNRSSTATLALNYRSTRGAQHTLTLPPGVELTEVAIDGRVEPLRAENNELTVPILPGEHRIQLTWRDAAEVSAKTTTPIVDIAAPTSNISLSMTLPANRWLLATSGPPLGPGVLYWSELVVLILFAVILGRTRLAPLNTRHWLLLGLGFSTFNWPVLGIVVAWLLACGVREKWRTDVAWWQFNLIQVAIAALTIIALLAIVGTLPAGLLGTPDMHVAGNGSYGNTLRWFTDRSESLLPAAAAWTVPMWIYKALILSWALWLSFALLRWLPWVWQCFSEQGYWRDRRAAALRSTGDDE